MTFLSNSIAMSGDTYVGDIGHSLRFRGAQYISKTITTSATSTYSFFVKRGKLGVISPIVESSIKFNANDTLTAFGTTTTAVFRDPTSWVHVHISNGGLYVNGVSLGAVTTSSVVNGRIGYDGTNYFDGYLARVCVVDGASSSYSNFGYLNTEINEWVSKSQSPVKAVVDAGGVNSFMLDFDDGTSLTTLGYDNSSKGNNWTLNNVSLTAGATYDWMLDVPGDSYATLNPLHWNGSAGNFSFANGNLNGKHSGVNTGGSSFGSVFVDTGTWYLEAHVVTSGRIGFGVASSINTAMYGANWNVQNHPNSVVWVGGLAGFYYFQNGANIGGSDIYANGDTIMIAFDAETRKVWFGKNGTWNNGGNPLLGTGQQGVAGGTSPLSLIWGNISSELAMEANFNFGQRPFSYTPPTGFLALCQRNMPEPAIKNPERHMDVVLATGANIKSTTEAVFPSNFLEWIKDRANSNNHQLIDTVRGTSAVLQSNTTAAETTYSAPSGLSVGWVWKAGGAAVTNNAGSIQSQVSANVEAGFSIVTYTGTGANATVGHGLGVTPKLMVIKRRDNTGNWSVYHALVDGSNDYLLLNSTQANNNAGTDSPTSTVFSIDGASANTNANGGTYVAYCFAEIPGYSKIGSYVGNGMADGPYVGCGFKPKFVMVKRTDTTSDWTIFDTARDPYNTAVNRLFPNLALAETTGLPFDIISNGFKLRDAAAAANGSGGTFIFIAFADVPAKYSLGR